MGLLDTKYEGVRGRDCGGEAGGGGRPWAGGGGFQASGQPLPAQSKGGFTGLCCSLLGLEVALRSQWEQGLGLGRGGRQSREGEAW